jgi:hypothetical protein
MNGAKSRVVETGPHAAGIAQTTALVNNSLRAAQLGKPQSFVAKTRVKSGDWMLRNILRSRSRF